MKKFLKVLAIFIFLVGSALIVLAVWVRHRYPPDRIRRLATEWAGTRLGREVEVSDARVGLFTGLDVRGVRVSEKPDFSAGTVLEAERMRIFPRWVPLLRRKIAIRSIELDKPVVHLRRAPDGTFNGYDAGAAPAPSTGSVHNASGFPLFHIDHAALTDGEVDYRDERLPWMAHLHRLDARVSGFSLTDPFTLKLQTDLQVSIGTSSLLGSLNLQAALSPGGNWPIELNTCHLTWGKSSFDLTGTFTPLPEPRAAATLAFSSLSREELSPFLPIPDPLRDIRLAGKWTLRATSAQLNAKGSFDARSAWADLSGSVALNTDGNVHEIQVAPTSFRLGESAFAPDVSGAGPLSGQWRVSVSSGRWNTAGEISAQGAVLSYGGWLEKPAGAPFALTGSAKNGEREAPSLRVDLRAPEMTIGPSGPWPKALHLSGTLGLEAKAEGPPSNASFTLSANGKSLEMSIGNSFRKPRDNPFVLSAAGRLKTADRPGGNASGGDTTLSLSAADLRTAAGTVSCRGEVKDLGKTRRLNLFVDGTISNLSELEKMLPSLSPYRPRGETTVTATLTGPADNPTGNGRILLSNASVSAVPGVDLSELNGTVRFSNDRAILETLHGKAFESPFTLSGRVEHFNRPTLFLEGEWERLEVERFLKQFSPSPSPPGTTGSPPSSSPAPIAQATGNFRIAEIVHPHYLGRDFRFRWNLSNVGPNLSILSGTATVTAASGEITNIPVAKKINRLMDRQGSDIAYNKLAGSFSMAGGTMEVQTFVLDSDQTDFSANGRVRLGDLESDLRLKLKLPSGSVRGSVGNWITADDGRPTIEARLKGPLSHADVKVDYRAPLRRAAQDILKKTLGGWKGKPDRSEKPPAVPDDTGGH